MGTVLWESGSELKPIVTPTWCAENVRIGVGLDSQHTFDSRSLVNKNRSMGNIYYLTVSVRKDFGNSLPEWFWMGESFWVVAAKASAQTVAF